MRIYSVGGGAFRVDGRTERKVARNVYVLESFLEIGRYCERKGIRLYDYAFECEGEGLREYLLNVWQTMKNAVATGDPICGLVQIPCIERNAEAAMRAMNAVSLAEFLSDSRKISFDLVVKTMYETGKDLNRSYRETSEGGLAKLYRR